MIYSDGSIYQGQFKNDKPDGAGITIMTKYHEFAKINQSYDHKGFYKAGLRQGNGVQVWEGQTKYKGRFEKGQLSSQNAIYKYQDKTMYEGDVVNGQFHGQGTLTFPNKSKYIGRFKNNEMNDSEATHIVLNDDGSTNEIYKGGFKNNLRHGTGTLKTRDRKKKKVRYVEGELKPSRQNSRKSEK